METICSPYAQVKQLRITPELIRVADGTHVWGEPYDGSSGDVFRLQADVAERVAEALRGTLEGSAARAVRASPTRDLEAFRLYTLGRAEWNLRTPQSLERAAGYFRQAIARDSTFARAWAGLADAYALFDYYRARSLPRDSAYALAKDAALRAIALDSTLAEPHASLNQILRYGYWDWAGSEREIRRAIQLDPNYATAHKWLAEHLLSQGRVDEGIAEARVAVQLDPLADPTQLPIGLALWYGGRTDEAVTVLRTALARNPASIPLTLNLWGLLLVTGRIGEATQVLEATRDTSSLRRMVVQASRDSAARRVLLRNFGKLTRGFSHFDQARVYALLGERERALTELETAVAEREPRVELIKVDPSWAPLWRDPRFARILTQVGLPP